MKKQLNTLLIGGCIVLCGQAQASLVKDGVWQIEPGDNLKSILKTALPEQPLRQKRLKRLSPLLNKRAFDEEGQLIVGQNLRLPGVRMPVSAGNAEKIADSEQIGKILITNGPTTAKAADGKQRVLNRGSAVNKGDTIQTQGARAQVRFTDGSLVALRPNTVFKVEEYNFNGTQDGSERGLYNLIKGGFRTISGAIGKVNKSNYRVKTPVATIGIRGTHYGVTLCSAGSCADQGLSDGLYGGVVDGSIQTTNDGGSSIFNNDEYFLIADLGSLAEQLLAPPGVIFDDPASPKTPEEQKKGKKEKTEKSKRIEEIVKNIIKEKKPDFDGTSLDSETGREVAAAICKELGIKCANLDLLNAAQIQQLIHPVLPGNAAPNGTITGFSFVGSDPFSGDPASVSSNLTHNSGTERITIGSVGGISKVLKGASFNTSSDGVALIRSIDTTGATLADAGNSFHANYDAGLGLGWGRWDNATVRATAIVGNTVVTKETKPEAGIHYIISNPNKVIDSASKLNSAVSSIGIDNIQPLVSIDRDPVQLNLVGQTLSKNLAGDIANSVTANLTLDFVNQSLTSFYTEANFGADVYNLGTTGAIPFSDLLGAQDSVGSLTGSCDSEGGGLCDTSIALEGNLNMILTNTGSNTIGAGVNFSGQTANSADPQIGFSGAAVFETQVPSPGGQVIGQ